LLDALAGLVADLTRGAAPTAVSAAIVATNFAVAVGHAALLVEARHAVRARTVRAALAVFAERRLALGVRVAALGLGHAAAAEVALLPWRAITAEPPAAVGAAFLSLAHRHAATRARANRAWARAVGARRAAFARFADGVAADRLGLAFAVCTRVALVTRRAIQLVAALVGNGAALVLGRSARERKAALAATPIALGVGAACATRVVGRADLFVPVIAHGERAARGHEERDRRPECFRELRSHRDPGF
jgi:hypothetical protein